MRPLLLGAVAKTSHAFIDIDGYIPYVHKIFDLSSKVLATVVRLNVITRVLRSSTPCHFFVKNIFDIVC